jgi:hypothetical protein
MCTKRDWRITNFLQGLVVSSNSFPPFSSFFQRHDYRQFVHPQKEKKKPTKRDPVIKYGLSSSYFISDLAKKPQENQPKKNPENQKINIFVSLYPLPQDTTLLTNPSRLSSVPRTGSSPTPRTYSNQ